MTHGCSQSGSSVHGILQASMVEWVAMSSSSGSSQPRDQNWVSYVSCIGRQVPCHSHYLREAQVIRGAGQLASLHKERRAPSLSWFCLLLLLPLQKLQALRAVNRMGMQMHLAGDPSVGELMRNRAKGSSRVGKSDLRLGNQMPKNHYR